MDTPHPEAPALARPPGFLDRLLGPAQRAGIMMAALFGGIPLGCALVALIHFGLLGDEQVRRYVHHPIEKVEVVMFCCALAALAAKVVQSWRERRAFRAQVLPDWQGQPVGVEEAVPLLAGISRLRSRLQPTLLVRRVAAVLAFLAQRRSTTDFDDHLRTLADNDALALENSYGLTRFISWAIPILGFLGTVLGITAAISGVTPEVLEKNLNAVTDGLALAFDATALALGLTMIVMFLSFVTDRQEQSILREVDHYVDRHLAHRFQRTDGMGTEFAEAVRQSTQALLQANEQIVQRQVDLWARSLEELDARRQEEEKRHQERFTAALETALEQTLRSHAQRMASLEKQTLEQSTNLMQHLTTLAGAIRETGREQQSGLVWVAEALATQTTELANLRAGEAQVRSLQETLSQNLAALASAETLEKAVHALTAAAHLLAARVPGESRTPPRPEGKPKPGAAA
jgi:biopolymer transport protein ExbB/TolQ